MREAEAVELVETAGLERLADVDTGTVYAHVDYLGRTLPGPVDLYRRWEHQHWAATDLDFGADREQWRAMPVPLRETLEGTFAGFFYGEQAVTDTLAPIVMAAPDEENRLFLTTQLVDEGRHSYFFARVFQEVLGVGGGLHGALAAIAPAEGSAGYGRIFDPHEGELFLCTDRVRRDPGDYGAWVQAVTVYHVMIEALLALTGQRRVLRILRAAGLMPAFRAGFTAVTRDESRHVSYGVWALREAVRAGRESDVRAVVDRTVRPCMLVYANPQFKLTDPREMPPAARQDPRDGWSFAVDSLCKRLRTAGLDPDYLAGIGRVAWAAVGEAVDRYEALHGEEHPVRKFDRGEVTAASD